MVFERSSSTIINTETNPISVPLHSIEEKVETAQIKSKSFVSKQPRGADIGQAENEFCE